MVIKTVGFVASSAPQAQAARKRLEKRYGRVDPSGADVVVALGGDGFMLETLHRFMEQGTPIYGMNQGSVGFLMNIYREAGLMARLRASQLVRLHPLRMRARGADRRVCTALAINEVSLLRQTRQAAKIRIHVDGVARVGELVCDGVLVSTAAGSTAYNLSAHGPIVPLGAEVLALTPISAFRPRRWRGALLPRTTHIRLEILDARKRPVSATADSFEVRHVREVRIQEDTSIALQLLFDPEHNLEERILNEQFTP